MVIECKELYKDPQTPMCPEFLLITDSDKDTAETVYRSAHCIRAGEVRWIDGALAECVHAELQQEGPKYWKLKVRYHRPVKKIDDPESCDTPKQTEQCKTCRWWAYQRTAKGKFFDFEFGQCRANPPQTTLFPSWPTTLHYDYCGAWKARDAEQRPEPPLNVIVREDQDPSKARRR